MSNAKFEEVLAHVKTASKPSELKITDIKICDIGRPYGTSVIKILTNQGIEGYGQVREGCSRVYAVMLKRLLIGENPCNVDKLFRRIKQFGWHSIRAAVSAALRLHCGISQARLMGFLSGKCWAVSSVIRSASIVIPIFMANTMAKQWVRC